MPRLNFILVISLLASRLAFSQTFVLSGFVSDRATAERLVAVNIRLAGTSRGTIANADGFYKMVLEPGTNTVVYSLVGYRSDTLRVEARRSMEYNPRLESVPIQIGEVTVTDEDPAVEIMRQVIENKKKWSERLQSYQLDAFTRFTMKRDTAIAMIMESYTTGYWQKGDTLREVVRQKRQTENLRGVGNFAAVGGIVNFYDDEIRFAGYHFVGPTSVDAFAYYDFTLENTREQKGIATYTIGLHPKSRLTPLFRGTINVVGDSYALVGVEVSPNEAFSIPFLGKLELHYAQQFALYEDRYWMPVDIRLKGQFAINLVGISLPEIGIEQVSAIYDYKINPQLADSIFKKPRRIDLPEAEKFDSSFWASRDLLPLTSEQQTAYRTLDSAQTLEKQFKPSGFLTLLNSPVFASVENLKLRYNRVEGFFLGAQVRQDSVTERLSLFGSGGYGFSDKRSKFRVGGEAFFDPMRRISFGVEGFKELENIPDEGYYDDFAILAGALLSKRDYRDYFYSSGWRFWLGVKPIERLLLQIGYRNADESTALLRTNYSFFEQDKRFRGNPPITDGTSRSFTFRARYGGESAPFGFVARDYAEVEAEYANPGLVAGSFDFTRVVARGEFHIKTYSRRFLFPPMLSLKMTAGMESGNVPPQRIFSLESQYDGFGPLGVLRGGEVKEFSGRQFVVFSVEHNFRSTPFLFLNIPFLYKSGVEFIVYGTAARTWSSLQLPFGQPTHGWYTEAGFGLSRILGFLRFNYTYRFEAPGGPLVSIGIAEIL